MSENKLDFSRLDLDEFNKPWGSYHCLARKDDKWFAKVIKVKKGHRLSLQKHFHREELWIITEGQVKVQKGKEFIELGPKETVFIEKEQEHRIQGITDAEFIEISFGDFSEEDEIRIEDDYGRA